MSTSHERKRAEKKIRQPSRVRQDGVRVTNTALAENPGQARIDAFRLILKEGYSIIDGSTVDAFTASAVVKVYDALNEANRAKFVSLSVLKMVSVTWKLVSKK